MASTTPSLLSAWPQRLSAHARRLRRGVVSWTALTLTIALALIGIGVGPAQASSTNLCTGFSACSSAGYSSFGYSSVYTTSYWGQYGGHNCTNYVAYRFTAAGVAKPSWIGSGNADSWGSWAASITNQSPSVGAIAWWGPNSSSGAYGGHVSIVQQVNADGSFVDSDDNWGGDFHWRKYTPGSSDWPTGFIHLNDGALAGTSGNPFGAYDLLASSSAGTVHVAGWAIDPDAKTSSIAVHVYVGGEAGQSGAVGTALTASLERDDVAKAYPGAGSAHGFDATINARAGTYPVCAYAINVGSGANVLLGCKTVTVADPNPFGAYDLATSPAGGQVHVQGWAIDPNARTAAIAVHVYVGGQAGQSGSVGHALTADVRRDDVAAAYPGSGSGHGFSATIAARAGTYPVCAYAINTGPGDNVLLGCKTVTVLPAHAVAIAHTQSAAQVVSGASVRLSATPTDATSGSKLASRVLTLERKSGSTWVRVLTATTSSSGLAKASVKPSAATTYRWAISGRATDGVYYKAATSSTFTVRVAVRGRTPTITGKAKVGRKLYAHAGTWAPTGVKLAYRWFADGEPIAGATRSTLTVPKAVAGEKVSVRVTGSKKGLVGVSMSSKHVRVKK